MWKALKYCEKRWKDVANFERRSKTVKFLKNWEKLWKNEGKRWKRWKTRKAGKTVNNGEKQGAGGEIERERYREGECEDWPMRGLETNHVISGPKRGLQKKFTGRGQTHIQTSRLTKKNWPKVPILKKRDAGNPILNT